MMKRIGKTSVLLAVCMTAFVLLAACSAGEDGEMYLNDQIEVISGKSPSGVYDGEWTVNRQVVDTARLEVSVWFKLRLPEDYLTRLCFPDYDQGVKIDQGELKPLGQPMTVYYDEQGYTAQNHFCTFIPSVIERNGKVHYCDGYFFLKKNGTDYRIDLLCSEAGSAVFQKDKGQWTVAIPIDGFLITETDTKAEREKLLTTPVTIYYNTKQRIR